MDHRRPSSPGNYNIREVRDVLLHDHDDDGIVVSSTKAPAPLPQMRLYPPFDDAPPVVVLVAVDVVVVVDVPDDDVDPTTIRRRIVIRDERRR